MENKWSTVGAVEVNGVRLGYCETGDPAGQPVVLVHGTTSNARTWDRFAARLTADGYRVIAVDLRGHATSARTSSYELSGLRDDLVGLLEALDLRDVVLIGHSVGGYAAVGAALLCPYRIDRLVLEDLAAPPRRLAPLLSGPWRLLAAAAAGLTARHAVASILLQLSRPDAAWWSQLHDVRHPTLILSGGPASCIPPRRLADVAAAMPDARLATIPIGHRIHSLAPEEFAGEVFAFLHTGRIARSMRSTAARGSSTSITSLV